MTRPRPQNETATTSSDQSPAVSPPSGFDPDWRERIEIAKQAREQARKARGDRPATFDTRGRPISWQSPTRRRTSTSSCRHREEGHAYKRSARTVGLS